MSGPIQQPPRTARWVRVLLALSLALNLLVLGAVGGALTMRGKWQGHARVAGFSGGPLTRALVPEDRRRIGQEIRAAYDTGALPRVDRAAALEALVADLRAVPFDPQAVAAELDDRQIRLEAHFRMAQRLLLDRLTQMTDAERAAFADRLVKGRKSRH